MIWRFTIIVVSVFIFKGNCWGKLVCEDGGATRYVGQWREWRSWSSCSKECGGGIQTRERTTCDSIGEEASLKLHGKKYSDKFEEQTCNNFCYNGAAFEGNNRIYFGIYDSSEYK